MAGNLTPEAVRQFRDALGAFATGVTIVTARGNDGSDTGLTANSFNSVSLDPPMVLWSLARSSNSLRIFEEAQHFAVHVLASDQQALSDRFARRGEDKFANLSIGRGRGGAALFEGCSARFECRTVFRYEGGDHVILVGEVESFEAGNKPPLIYHSGKYGLVVRRATRSPEPVEANSDRRNLLTFLLSAAFHQTFLPVRRAFRSHGLSEDEYYTLSALGISDRRELGELGQLLGSVGRDATEAPSAGLREKGFACDVEAAGQTFLTLTEAGRGLALEFLAIAKAAEADMTAHLDEGEALLLRQMLSRIVRISSPGGPSVWKKVT